jgi:hypothetical protein
MYRAKYVANLRAAGIADQQLFDALFAKPWVVYAKRTFGKPHFENVDRRRKEWKCVFKNPSQNWEFPGFYKPFCDFPWFRLERKMFSLINGGLQHVALRVREDLLDPAFKSITPPSLRVGFLVGSGIKFGLKDHGFTEFIGGQERALGDPDDSASRSWYGHSLFFEPDSLNTTLLR